MFKEIRKEIDIFERLRVLKKDLGHAGRQPVFLRTTFFFLTDFKIIYTTFWIKNSNTNEQNLKLNTKIFKKEDNISADSVATDCWTHIKHLGQYFINLNEIWGIIPKILVGFYESLSLQWGDPSTIASQ